MDEMDSNDFDPNDPIMRRGSNVIQGLISNKKRRMNRTPLTPLGLKRILEGSPGAEVNTEGSDSDSPAYNPTSPPSIVESTESYATSPPSTVQTTESSGSARNQGPRTILKFTPVREPEPAVDSAEARANRRYKQLIEKGFSANMEDLVKDLNERDARDVSRSSAPLKPAPGAYVLDTSQLTANESVYVVLDLYAKAIKLSLN